MRFHGMIGDKVSISTTGQAWRPPEYITTPTQKIRPESGLRRDDDPAQKSDRSKRLMKDQNGDKKKYHRTRGLPNPKRTNKLFQDEGMPGEGRLPLPSTYMRSVHSHARFSYRQRICAISLAILMAFALFANLIALLSQQLEKVASKVESQNEILRHSYHFGQIIENVQNQESHIPRRKLLGAVDDSSSNRIRRALFDRTSRDVFSDVINSISAVQQLLKILRSGHDKAPIFTASILHNHAPLPGAKSLSYFKKPSSAYADAGARIKSLQEELQKIYYDLSQRRVPGPSQIPQGEAKDFGHRITGGELQGRADIRSPKRVMNNLAIGNANEKWASKKVTAVPSQPDPTSNILHSSALNVIGDVGSQEVATKSNDLASEPSHIHRSLPTPVLSKPPHVNNQYPPGNVAHARTGRTVSPLQLLQNRNTEYPETVEVWALPRGKSLCRLFNIARLPDGRLVLPKWMKKHAEFLSSRCSIKGAIFAVENISEKRMLQLNSSMLRAAINSEFEVDWTNSGRDLCGTVAPRNHMPHFVTDILLPLVASEVLLGSGRGQLQSSTLLPTGAKDIDVRSVPTFSALKPSILVFEETWNRPLSEWVPRLAQFFLHPKIGFTLLRGGKEKEPRALSSKVKPKISAFRSVISSNIERHLPLGLFGPDGKNIVLEANGISRSPAWTTNGMRENPCRVAITVLTRKGPRALLKLDSLEEKIKKLCRVAAVRAEIRVVDFEEKSFDDQVKIMQETNILIATHGAGNANFVFMRPSAAVIEIFPFSYKAGPFDSFARIFGLDYKFAMSAPQTEVFKECMHRHESNQRIKQLAFSRWDMAVQTEKSSPWVHRLEFEKEFGEPGKSEGMTTRMCVRMQELEFNIDAVSRMAVDSGTAQCAMSKST